MFLSGYDNMARMLLSHNFNLYKQELPELDRQQFAQVFTEGLEAKDGMSASLIENPHWIVEIIYDEAKVSADEVGRVCCDVLVSKRKQQVSSKLPHILFLGGKKTTPATSTSATSLKPGEWGVDVVETADADGFLASIRWEEMTANKPTENIFKIEH